MEFSSPTSISGSLYHFNYYKTPILISQTGAQPLCGVPGVRLFLDATVSPGCFFWINQLRQPATNHKKNHKNIVFLTSKKIGKNMGFHQQNKNRKKNEREREKGTQTKTSKILEQWWSTCVSPAGVYSTYQTVRIFSSSIVENNQWIRSVSSSAIFCWMIGRNSYGPLHTSYDWWFLCL